MATHTRKKPYHQTSKITSFFPPSLQSSSSSPASLACPPSRPTPPPQIQSSLLNVGMRVRKSVPEGYKTHKTLALSSSQPVAATRAGGGEWDAPPPPSSAPAALQGRDRELVPFCGLHSVGGWGPGVVPGLSGSSQSTVSSSSATSEVGRKRRPDHGDDEDDDAPGGGGYDEAVEAEMDAFFGDGAEELLVRERELGPTSRRRIAQPWSRMGRKTGPTLAAAAAAAAGAGGGVALVGDFEDGDVGFLAPMDVDA